MPSQYSTVDPPPGTKAPGRNDGPVAPSALTGQDAQDAAGPVNLKASQLSSLSSQLFLAHLSSIPTAKTLILDPALAGPLGLVVDTGSLKAVGVERMFWMEEGEAAGPQSTNGKNVNAPTKAVVYVCRPDEKWMRVIQSHINFDVNKAQGPSLTHVYHALLTPHRTELSLLSLAPVLSHLNIYDFGIEFIPLEPDLLSLEEPGAAWKELYLTGDQTILHRSAMALMTCQLLWGCFPRITGKGDLAKRLADLLTRQRREHLTGDPTNPSLNSLSTVVDGLVIVERGTDMVTPMCTQLTYAGLVDEVIGIKSAHVEVDQSLLSANSSQQQPDASTPSGSSTPLVTSSSSRPTKKYRLDPTADVLYSRIRDLNFSVVGSVLHDFARRLSSSYQDRHSANTVSEMRAWVGKLGGLQSEHTALRLHTALTESLMAETNSETFNRCLEIQQNIVAGVELSGQLSAIEDLINLEAPLAAVLRLLCLFSTVSGGLKAKNLEYIKREVCQTYGYEQLVTLLNLERVGLIVKARPTAGTSGAAAVLTGVSGASSSATSGNGNSGDVASTFGNAAVRCFDRVRQPLRLINDDVSEAEPTDVAYVYSGYAPLSVRLVQAVGQKEALVGGVAASNTRTAGANAGLKKPRAHPLVGWKGFEDVMAAVPGETFDFVQRASLADASNRPQGWMHSDARGLANHPARSDTLNTTGDDKTSSDKMGGGGKGGGAPRNASDNSPVDHAPNAPWSTDPDRKRTTVVFFLGGVTQAEISAVRFMGSQSRNRRWLIATTGLITGGAIIDMASGCPLAKKGPLQTK
ncbi:unnamed protein product [Parajaminaea phylloscopi]